MLYGKYRGIVRDVADPEQRGRIRVECKEVYGASLSPWALPCFTPNQFRVPSIGSMAWIEFEKGQKQFPVWTGCVYTRTEVSTKFLRGKQYAAGLVVEVTEAEKAEYIAGNAKQEVGGNLEETTAGNMKQEVTGNASVKVTGTLAEVISTNHTETVTGHIVTSASNAFTSNVPYNHSTD